jgi:hypothetical protein
MTPSGAGGKPFRHLLEARINPSGPRLFSRMGTSGSLTFLALLAAMIAVSLLLLS